MARVTARHAFTRSKAKRQKQRDAEKNQLTDARRIYLLHLAEMLNIQGKPNGGGESSGVPKVGQQNGDNTNPRALIRQPLASNRKLTDFYPVYSRGRENIPKSPPAPKVRGPSIYRQHSTNLRPLRPGSPELIIIDDSSDDDDGESNRSLGNSYCSNRSTDSNPTDTENVAPPSESRPTLIDQNANIVPQANSHHFSVSVPALKDVKPIILNSNGPIPQLDNLSLSVDEEVEITAFLPPIPLRDHEVFDLED